MFLAYKLEWELPWPLRKKVRLNNSAITTYRNCGGSRKSCPPISKGPIPWQNFTPDERHAWTKTEHAEEYQAFPALDTLFEIQSRWLLETTRDEVVYDFDACKLRERILKFIDDYNLEVDRHKRDKEADYPDHIKWSSRLKECLSRGRYAVFEESKTRQALYRPFVRRWVFFDAVLNQRLGQWPVISGKVIWVKVGPDWPFFALASSLICDLLPQGGSQCFPLSHLKETALIQFRNRYTDDTLTKEAIFQYIYALLHCIDGRIKIGSPLR
jgi:predicted helicase